MVQIIREGSPIFLGRHAVHAPLNRDDRQQSDGRDGHRVAQKIPPWPIECGDDRIDRRTCEDRVSHVFQHCRLPCNIHRGHEADRSQFPQNPQQQITPANQANHREGDREKKNGQHHLRGQRPAPSFAKEIFCWQADDPKERQFGVLGVRGFLKKCRRQRRQRLLLHCKERNPYRQNKDGPGRERGNRLPSRSTAQANERIDTQAKQSPNRKIMRQRGRGEAKCQPDQSWLASPQKFDPHNQIGEAQSKENQHRIAARFLREINLPDGQR
jgi:hypothetical protein